MVTLRWFALCLSSAVFGAMASSAAATIAPPNSALEADSALPMLASPHALELAQNRSSNLSDAEQEALDDLLTE